MVCIDMVWIPMVYLRYVYLWYVYLIMVCIPMVCIPMVCIPMVCIPMVCNTEIFRRKFFDGNLLTEIFWRKFHEGYCSTEIIWREFFEGSFLTEILWRKFSTNFLMFWKILTYNLLTIASFRIGVPSILFFSSSCAKLFYWIIFTLLKGRNLPQITDSFINGIISINKLWSLSPTSQT